MNNKYQSPRWSAEALYCPNPLAFDQYSNCSHKCAYCFSQFQRLLIRGKGRQDYIENKTNFVDIEKVKRIFLNKRPTQFSKYIEMKKLLQWGSLSDPFCHYEKKYNVGLELLRFFREIDYPIVFGTKATWWTKDKRYSELFENNKKWKVRISLVTTNNDILMKLEKGTATVKERLNGLEYLKKINVGKVVLRMRPFIFGISDLTYKELIQLGSKCGVDSISLGFFCHDYRMTKDNLETIDLLTGFDQNEFYKTFTSNKGSPLRLNRNIKRDIINEVEELCIMNKIQFTVGDRHFKERSQIDISNNQTERCKGQFAQAASICRINGIVKWEDISWDMQHFENVKTYLFNEKCETTSQFFDFSIKDYFHYLWNNPNESRSPYKIFEGIMIPFDKDTNGDLIYKYNKERE